MPPPTASDGTFVKGNLRSSGCSISKNYGLRRMSGGESVPMKRHVHLDRATVPRHGAQQDRQRRKMGSQRKPGSVPNVPLLVA